MNESTKQLLVIGGIVVAVLAFPVSALVKSAAADGDIDFCFIDGHISTGPNLIYTVVGHRPWRPDAIVARTNTLEEAVAAARTAGCPLRHGK